MNTPRDIIARAIANGLLHECNCADDGEADKICDYVLRELSKAGFAVERRRPSVPQKADLVREMEAAVAAQTEDFVRELRRGRDGLRK